MKGANPAEIGTARVVFHDKTRSKEEFIVFANPHLLEKWRKNKDSVPLVEVVDSFEVFTNSTNKGADGLLDRPGKGVLAGAFGTEDKNEVVAQILEHGQVKGNANSANIAPKDRAGAIKPQGFRHS